ncbi:MAG: acyltransferase family protein [Acidimicrobiales bacterium]
MTAASPATDQDRAEASRALNLDALRALAALYVLAGHAYLLSGTAIGFHDRHPVRLLINSGGSGVWLFFALSGYLIAGPFIAKLLSGDPLPDVGSYARRRFLRIYPAYWVAFAAVLAFGLAPGQTVSAGQLIVHGLLLHNLVRGEQQAIYFASWTLTLEVLFYAVVPLLALAVRRLRPGPVSPRALVTAVLLMWASSIVFVMSVPSFTTGSTQLWLRILFPSMFSMFCPGMLVAIAARTTRAGDGPRWFQAIAEHRRLSLLVVAVLAVGGALGATAVPLRVYLASRQLFALASGIALVLALTRGPVRLGGSLLRWLGEISYGIYLWQGVVIYVLLRHEQVIPMQHTGLVAYVVHVGLLAAATLPLAWLSWHLIERRAIALGRSH